VQSALPRGLHLKEFSFGGRGSFEIGANSRTIQDQRYRRQAIRNNTFLAIVVLGSSPHLNHPYLASFDRICVVRVYGDEQISCALARRLPDHQPLRTRCDPRTEEDRELD